MVVSVCALGLVCMSWGLRCEGRGAQQGLVVIALDMLAPEA